MKAPVPILYINNGIALFWGDCLKTDIHSHYALQIAILLEGKYKLFIDNREIEKSVFINSDTPHRHIRQSGKQLSIFIEPESALGGAIRTSCPENYRILTRLKQSEQKREGEKIVEALSSKKLSQEMVENFIREIIPVRIPSRKSDRRIDLLLEKIERQNRTFREMFGISPMQIQKEEKNAT